MRSRRTSVSGPSSLRPARRFGGSLAALFPLSLSSVHSVHLHLLSLLPISFIFVHFCPLLSPPFISVHLVQFPSSSSVLSIPVHLAHLRATSEREPRTHERSGVTPSRRSDVLAPFTLGSSAQCPPRHTSIATSPHHSLSPWFISSFPHFLLASLPFRTLPPRFIASLPHCLINSPPYPTPHTLPRTASW